MGNQKGKKVNKKQHRDESSQSRDGKADFISLIPLILSERIRKMSEF